MIEPLTQGGAQDALTRCLSLILQEDDRWHAMLAINPQAEAEAEAADHAAAQGQGLGPLHGVVLAIKDNIDVAGMATTSGCKALARAMVPGDAPVVARLRAAGAVVVGKTNLSEFSFEIRSRSSLGGDVRCPFAPDSTAGGSSGGSAVAVARGFAMAALGTDTGGSIRIPAACNGLVGLRPAHGMLSLEGVAPLAPSTDTIGPITRSVADARLLYEIMGGQIGGTRRPAAWVWCGRPSVRMLAFWPPAIRRWNGWRVGESNWSIRSPCPASRICWPGRISSMRNLARPSTPILPGVPQPETLPPLWPSW